MTPPLATPLSRDEVTAALEQPRTAGCEVPTSPVSLEAPIEPPAVTFVRASGSNYCTIPAIGREISWQWSRIAAPRAPCTVLLTLAFVAVGSFGALLCTRLQQENRLLREEAVQMRRFMGRLRTYAGQLHEHEEDQKQEFLAAHALRHRPHPAGARASTGARERPRPASPVRTKGVYESITGLKAHQLPKMYGSVREKTIWSYWYHPKDCPSSQHCKLPTVVELCAESIRRNRGGFDFRIVHRDEVEKYLTWIELPLRWRELKPPQQKDSLMNALLARYGGVAMDISTILLRPLDGYWDEMVARAATFRGYVYRLNGRPWRHAEVTAVWFLMSRREGIFTTAVRNQVTGMGDRPDPSAYRHWYLALGDQTLLPILTIFNYSLPKCYDDPTVNVDPSSKLHQFSDQDPRMCPEHEQRPWYKGITGPPRNDTRLLLEDPRDGPQLPFAFEGMATWRVDDATNRTFQHTPGSPMQDEECSSMKECWEDVVLRRCRAPEGSGRLPAMLFVKLFKHAQELAGKSRKEILADSQTYFYQLLKLARVVEDSSGLGRRV